MNVSPLKQTIFVLAVALLLAFLPLVALPQAAAAQVASDPPADAPPAPPAAPTPPPAEPDVEPVAEVEAEVEVETPVVPEPEVVTPEPPADPGRIEVDEEPESEPDAGVATEAEEAEEEFSPDDPVFYARLNGEYALHVNAMTDIPLTPLPRDETGETADLGQNLYLGQWLHLNLEIGVRPQIEFVFETDILEGLVLGDFTQGVGAADHARDDATAFPGLHPHKAYMQWNLPIGVMRVGMQTSHWGLGMVANDGEHESVFGEARLPDTVLRLGLGTKPLGVDSPFTIAVAGDLVYDDTIAELADDERALQAVLAAYYQEEGRSIGGYLVYRSQRDGVGDLADQFDAQLEVVAMDLFARWDTPEPSGGRFFGAVELAYIHGTTSQTRTRTREEFDVRQFMAVAQVGRTHDNLDVVLEFGYASGDSNSEDDTQRRASMDPARRVGLIMFSEVLNWQTARASTLAQSEVLTGRPAPGSDRIPTNGGVSGAMYLFPTATYRPTNWLDARFGAVWARATTPIVDPFVQRSQSRSVNYRGGSSANQDLGLELDASIRVSGDIADGVGLEGLLEGGLFLPGHGFDNALGETMSTVGLVRLRGILSF